MIPTPLGKAWTGSGSYRKDAVLRNDPGHRREDHAEAERVSAKLVARRFFMSPGQRKTSGYLEGVPDRRSREERPGPEPKVRETFCIAQGAYRSRRANQVRTCRTAPTGTIPTRREAPRNARDPNRRWRRRFSLCPNAVRTFQLPPIGVPCEPGSASLFVFRLRRTGWFD